MIVVTINLASARTQELTWEKVKTTRVGYVKNYTRLSYNVWRLIALALLSAFPEENTHKRNCDCVTCVDPEVGV